MVGKYVLDDFTGNFLTWLCPVYGSQRSTPVCAAAADSCLSSPEQHAESSAPEDTETSYSITVMSTIYLLNTYLVLSLTVHIIRAIHL